MNPVVLPPLEKPTRARYVVLALLCGMAFILYLDRICMGQAAPAIQEELGISNTWMGGVHIAFTLAYGLFEVPTGRWGDRYGSRSVLARIVVCWSLFTALTGAAAGFWQLVLVRFLFGAGEAGAYPNTARVFARWFTDEERGRLNGFMLAFASIGAAVSPWLASRLIETVGWRWTFPIFGAVGLVWAAVFYWWFRDDPAEHPAVNHLELAHLGAARQQPHHEPIPWGLVFRNPNIWLLGGIMTLASFMSYMYFAWYPTYLQKGRGLTRTESGELTSLVLFIATGGILLGGFAASWISRQPRRQLWRQLLCGVLFAAASGLLWVSIHSDDALLSAVFAGLSCACMFSYQANWWASVIELSGKHLGALFGLLNGMGVFGAMASQFLFGKLADWRGEQGYSGREQWDPALYVYVVVLAAGAVCWLFVNTAKPLQDDEASRAA